MRSDLKDIILFFTLAMFNQTYQSWFMIFSYIASYIKMKNPSMTFNHFFSCAIFLTAGTIIGNMILPYLFNRFQIRHIYLVGSIAYLINLLLFLVCTRPYLLYANATAAGVLNQVFQLGSLAYFKYKYKDDCVKYFGVISVGYPVGLMIVSLMINFLVNPQNQSMNYLKFGEPAFYPSVSKNIVLFLWIQGLSMLAIGIFFFFKLEDINMIDPTQPSKITEMEDYFIDNKVKDIIDNKVKEIVNQKSGAILTSFHPTNELLSFRFQFIFVCNILKFMSLQYIADNYHYMASFIIHDDSFTINIYIISTVSAVSARFFSGFIWSKFGMDKCYTFAFLASILSNILYISFGLTSAAGFGGLIFYVRIIYGLNYLWANMALFTVYQIEEALIMAKYFDIYLLIVVVLDNLLNQIFVNVPNFYGIFFAFLVIESIGFGVYLQFRKKFMLSIGEKCD